MHILDLFSPSLHKLIIVYPMWNNYSKDDLMVKALE